MTTSDLTTANDWMAQRRSRILPEVVAALIDYAHTEDPSVLPDDMTMEEFGDALWDLINEREREGEELGEDLDVSDAELALHRLGVAVCGPSAPGQALSEAELTRRRPVKTESVLKELASIEESYRAHRLEAQAREAVLTDAAQRADGVLRRLSEDRPDLYARVLAKELSPKAAMVEARFRRTITVSADVEGLAQALRRHLSAEQRAQLRDALA